MASRRASSTKSQDVTLKPHRSSRRTNSLELARSINGSGRLSHIESYRLSIASRHSVLNDRTDIDEPRRKLWWRRLELTQRDNMDVQSDNNDPLEQNNILEELDVEVLSKENDNDSLDLPESSGTESIRSIVIQHRKLFTEKENVPNKLFKRFATHETLSTMHKTNNTAHEKSVNVAPKELFQKNTRSKHIFPTAAHLITSRDKTTNDKTLIPTESKKEVHNLFSKKQGGIRKNMFANFLVSESEDEILEPPTTQKTQLFGKNRPNFNRRPSSARDSSPTSSIATDMEFEDWKLLPSSTMMENQLEAMIEGGNTPKRIRLSKLSEAKESVAGTTQESNKTKKSNNFNQSTLSQSKANRDLKGSISNKSKMNNEEEIAINRSQQSIQLSKSNNNSNVSHSSITRSKTKSHSIYNTKNDSKTKQNIKNNKNDENLKDSNVSHSSITRSKNKSHSIYNTNNDSKTKQNITNNKNDVNLKNLQNIKNTTNILEPEAQNHDDDDEMNFTLEYENDSNVDEIAVDEEAHEYVESINTSKSKQLPDNTKQISNNEIKLTENDMIKSNNTNSSIQKTLKSKTMKEFYATNISTKSNETVNVPRCIESQNEQFYSESQGKVNYSDDNNEQIINSRRNENVETIEVRVNDTEAHKSSNEIDIGLVVKLDNKDDNSKTHDHTVKSALEQLSNKDIVQDEQNSQINKSKKTNNVQLNKSHNKSKQEVHINKTKTYNEEIENKLQNKSHSNTRDSKNNLSNAKQNNQHNVTKESNNKEINSDLNENIQDTTQIKSYQNQQIEENEIEFENCNKNEENGQEINNTGDDALTENPKDKPQNSTQKSEQAIDNKDADEETEVEKNNESNENEQNINNNVNETVIEETDNEQQNTSQESDHQLEDDGEMEIEETDDNNISKEEQQNTHNGSREETEEHQNLSQESEHEEEEIEVDETDKNNSEESEHDEEEIDVDETDINNSEDDEQEIEEQQNLSQESEHDDENEQEMDIEEYQFLQYPFLVHFRHQFHNSSEEDEQQNVSRESEHDVEDEEVEGSHENNVSENNERIEDSEYDQQTKDDTPNVSRNNDSPDVILRGTSKQFHSFHARGRNTSVRKSKSITKAPSTTLRHSFSPARDSVGFSDGTNNSSAEGSGWDSHRTTRKTLRQTFGKDFTPRKSLRALVMEKYAKRQTMENDNIASITSKFPQANSTELGEESSRLDNDEINRAQQAKQEFYEYIEKQKQKCIEDKMRIAEAAKKFLAATRESDAHLFKVPAKPKPRIAATSKTIRKPKPKSTLFQNLPKQLLDDLAYKPPKRYQPRDAAWITKRLYKFLETKLQPKYDYKSRVRAEALVEKIYNFTKDVRRNKGNAPPEYVSEIKREMARLNIVKTHFEFHNFIFEFMPREVRIKVVPDVVNNIPLPRDGIFSDILQ